MQKLKVVIDTNIILGAYFRNEKYCINVLTKENNFEFITYSSTDMIEELLSVLKAYYYNTSFKDMTTLKVFMVNTERKLLRYFRRSVPIEPISNVNYIKEDETDNVFLNCAIDSNSDIIVTENIHHFDKVKDKIKNRNGKIIKIYSAEEFINILNQQQVAIAKTN